MNSWPKAGAFLKLNYDLKNENALGSYGSNGNGLNLAKFT